MNYLDLNDMLYIIKSFGNKGKEIIKVGFASDIKKRVYQYTSHNPLCELISIREGEILEETLLHLYLSHKYYRYKSLDEWYVYDDGILRDFHQDLRRIKKYLWKYRDNIFKKEDFKKTSKNEFPLNKIIYEKLLKEYGKDLRFHDIIDYDKNIILGNAQVIDKIYYSEIIIKSQDTTNILNPIIDNFLSEFFKITRFRDKMKLYCEFRDKYLDNKEISLSLHYKIEDPRFENYYNYYGTDRCRSVGYEDKPLRDGISDKLLQDPLSISIYSNFKESQRYTLKEIKEKLGEIYQNLGITKTPKASNLSEYFEVSKTRITTSDGVRDGYKLIKIK